MEDNTNANMIDIPDTEELNEILMVRRQKLKELQQSGKDPFRIVKYNVTHHSNEIIENFESMDGMQVSAAGRLMSKRDMGKASFCDIHDPWRQNPDLCQDK